MKLTKNKAFARLIGLFLIVLLGFIYPVFATDLTINSGTTSSAANEAVTKARTALTEIPANWMLLIGVIVAASVVISIVVSSLKRD